MIAQLLRTGEYVQSQVAEELIQSLREITKLRYELLKERKNYQRQVFSLLSIIFPEYEKTTLKNPFSVASLAILQKFPTAKDLAQAKPKQIEKIVRSIKGNHFDLKEIETLIQTAQTSIYSGRAKEARSTSLRILLRHIETLSSSIEELETEIQELLSPQQPPDHLRRWKQDHRRRPFLPGNQWLQLLQFHQSHRLCRLLSQNLSIRSNATGESNL